MQFDGRSFGAGRFAFWASLAARRRVPLGWLPSTARSCGRREGWV